MRFQGKGMAHHTHGIVFEAGVYRVRRLELPAGAMEAFIARHQMFMPENAEALSEPIGEIVLEAQSLEALLERLDEVW